MWEIQGWEKITDHLCPACKKGLGELEASSYSRLRCPECGMSIKGIRSYQESGYHRIGRHTAQALVKDASDEAVIEVLSSDTRSRFCWVALEDFLILGVFPQSKYYEDHLQGRGESSLTDEDFRLMDKIPEAIVENARQKLSKMLDELVG